MLAHRFIIGLLILCTSSSVGAQALELVDQFHSASDIEHYTLSPMGYVGYFFTEVDEKAHTSNRYFVVRDVNDIAGDAVFSVDGLLSHHISMAALDGSSRLIFISDSMKYSLYDLAISQGVGNWTDDSIAIPISSVALSEFSLAIAHGMPEATITVRDLATREVLATLTGHENFIAKVVIGSDDNILASMSDDNEVKVWNIQKGREVASFEAYASDIAISADKSTLIIKEADTLNSVGDIILVDLNTLVVTKRIAGVSADIIYADMGADISAAGRLLAVSHEGFTVLDIASGEILKQAYPYATASTISPIYDVIVSADNQFLVVAKRDGVDVWRWADGAPMLP